MCASVIEVKVSRRNRPLGSSLGDFEVRRFVKDADQAAVLFVVSFLTFLKIRSILRNINGQRLLAVGLFLEGPWEGRNSQRERVIMTDLKKQSYYRAVAQY
jgi:hypothetical protein